MNRYILYYSPFMRHWMLHFMYWFIFTLISTIWSCNRRSHISDQAGTSTSTATEPILIPEDSAHFFYDDLFNKNTVFDFYRRKDFKPVWLADNNFSLRADSMIALIKDARSYGLLPQDYHLHEIESMIGADGFFDKEMHVIRADILLSDAFLTMADHLNSGRINKTGDRRLQTNVASDTTLMLLLNNVLAGKGVQKVLESQEPRHERYKLLRAELRKLLQTAEPDEQCELLEGKTADTNCSRKISILEINMERWRWNEALPERYILINIPSYTLWVIESDEVVLQSRIIVGTPENPTPVLNGLIECFVIYPYWNVPRSIATKELLPKIKKDSTYIERHHYDVLTTHGAVVDPSSVDWKVYSADNFPFSLRQREGSDNTLGIIKFQFNNPYSVYLHDTNAKRLFRKTTRALSHGCVRVEKAIELANYLIADDSIYCSPEDLVQYLELSQRKDIILLHPIPLLIRYFTAEYGDGDMKFLPDIYQMDEQLMEMIYSRREPDLWLGFK